MQLGQKSARRVRMTPRGHDAFDSVWKEAMHAFFRSFVEFFFPEAYADIDWEEGFEALDTELRQIAGKSRASPLRADSLFKVRRLSGGKHLLLIHTEVQTSRDSRMAERMFRYNYRSFDAQGLPVASFAILGDASKSWRPDGFGWSLWGCEMGIRFPIVKLVDYEGRDAELEANPNPFALITRAYLRTRSTSDDSRMRRQWKFQIVRMLYERNYSEEDVRILFRVIDWMMKLEDEEAIIFMQDLERLEAEKGMPYVTSVERIAKKIGREEGREEGRQEGRRDGIASLLLTQLAQRFGQVPDWASQKLKSAPPESLESWGRRVFEARSLEEIFA
jgi:hypothetical protein